MVTVYVGVGSNLPGRLEWLEKAREMLAERFGVEVRRSSPIYETSPVGKGLDGKFLNAVWEIETEMEAKDLLGRLKIIEHACGRSERLSHPGQYQNRTIDLDILFYGSGVVESEELVIPHPRLHERKFVLKPLADLNPELIHPWTGRKIRELLDKGSFNGQEVYPYPAEVAVEMA